MLFSIQELFIQIYHTSTQIFLSTINNFIFDVENNKK